MIRAIVNAIIYVLETIKEIIIVMILLGVASAFIDYSRMTGGKVPIFNVSHYNANTKIQTFRGMFYEASRKVHISEKEPLIDSTKMKYNIDLYFYTYELHVPVEFQKEKFEFVLLTTPTINCQTQSTLYYADENAKFYTYCLDSVKLKELGESKSIDLIEYLKKDGLIVEDIVMNMSYVGLAEDGTTQKFKTLDDSFVSNGLTLYRCHKLYIDDIYIAPANTPMQSDFCTYKDDDFEWLWKVEHEDVGELTEEENTPYVFLEDEINRYEFSNQKVIDNTYIIRDHIRGREKVQIPLRQIFDTNRYSLDQLTERGLKYNTINKEEERIRLEEEQRKKEEEERKKKEEEEQKALENQTEKPVIEE